MSSDGEHFTFDANANQNGTQGDRHSPPALDEGHHPGDKQANRPPSLFLPRQGSIEHTRFEEILKKTKNYETISLVPYHIREEVKDSLNVTKESRDDWRGVASRMGVKAPTIEKIARDFKEDPTNKLFLELSSKKTQELLQVLYQMDLQDVLNIFYDRMCITNKPDSTGAGEKREKYQSSKFPSQESTPVSGASSTSEFISSPHTPKSPFNTPKDTGTPESAERSDSGLGSTSCPLPTSRPKTGSFAKQNSDKDLTRSLKSTVNFHSAASADFWHKIPPKPGSSTKEWKQVEEVLKKDFSKQSMQSQVMRFICYVLKIEPYEERHTKFVHEQDFANLVAWFGPVKDGKDGLFEKITQLIKGSTTYKGSTGPHSFFAGYMTKDEADQLIGNLLEVGTFLIRFSSTYAQNGSFIVCLKTNAGAEHVLLEGNPATGKISYDGKDYDDLVTLYRRALCKGGVSQDRRTSCTTICANLPLNAMFKPYGAGPRPPQPLGRGRGRGRGQEQ